MWSNNWRNRVAIPVGLTDGKKNSSRTIARSRTLATFRTPADVCWFRIFTGVERQLAGFLFTRCCEVLRDLGLVIFWTIYWVRGRAGVDLLSARMFMARAGLRSERSRGTGLASFWIPAVFWVHCRAGVDRWSAVFVHTTWRTALCTIRWHGTVNDLTSQWRLLIWRRSTNDGTVLLVICRSAVLSLRCC